MTFDAEEFLNLALWLDNNQLNEAVFRTQVSRAYYACHLVGRKATQAKGWFQPDYTGGDHQKLINVLKERRLPWHSQLLDLFRLREHVDYHTDSASALVGSNKGCSYCKNNVSGKPLVDKNTWEEAKGIAQNVLPRLKSIAPTR